MNFFSKAERDKWWSEVNSPAGANLSPTRLDDARHSTPVPTLSIPIPRAPEPPVSRETPTPAKPKAILAPPVERNQEYEALVAELGITCAELETLKLKALLHKHHMPIYDLGEVHAYLQKQAGRNEVHWFPLRPGYATSRPRYTKTVPIHVLRRVQTLLAENAELEFFVSEIRASPDPFLMVRTWRSHDFIIAMWDEPGFEGRPEVL